MQPPLNLENQQRRPAVVNPWSIEISEFILELKGQTAIVADLHLCEALPITTQRFWRWLDQLNNSVQTLIILGDLFAYWVGDDQLCHDHIAQKTAWQLKKSAQRHKIYLVSGNRDFLLGDTFATQAGVSLIHGAIRFKTLVGDILLCHGDELVWDDESYMQFRQMARSQSWQTKFLTESFAQREARVLEYRNNKNAMKILLKDISTQACQWLFSEKNVNWVIHGHTHLPCDHWHHGRLRQVLSDWDLDRKHGPTAEALYLVHTSYGVQVVRESIQ